MIAAVFNADLLVLPNSVRSRVPLGKPFIAKLTEQEQREVIRFIGAGKPLPDDLLGTKRTPSRSAPFQRRLIQVWGTFRLSPSVSAHPSPSSQLGERLQVVLCQLKEMRVSIYDLVGAIPDVNRPDC
jgi:hypothetical protein